MKLTKAQRLFVAIGHIDLRIAYTSEYLWACFYSKSNDRKKTICAEDKHRLKQLRALRKRLIREALKAWRDETDNLFIDGYQTCFKRTKEWELYRTEHT